MRKNLYITIHYTQHSGLNSTINESKFAVVLEYIYIYGKFIQIYFSLFHFVQLYFSPYIPYFKNILKFEKCINLLFLKTERVSRAPFLHSLFLCISKKNENQDTKDKLHVQNIYCIILVYKRNTIVKYVLTMYSVHIHFYLRYLNILYENEYAGL